MFVRIDSGSMALVLFSTKPYEAMSREVSCPKSFSALSFISRSLAARMFGDNYFSALATMRTPDEEVG